MPAHSYKDLKVWQKAMQLTLSTYGLVSKLPNEERFALANQMRRCAVSIPSNIAEGQRRLGDAETIHFCSIALGSTAELETQLILTNRLYKISADAELELCKDVGKMLSGLIRVLKMPNNSRAKSQEPRA